MTRQYSRHPPPSGAVPEPVGDRIAPIAAEILPGDLHARRRLAALVFGKVEKMLDTMHDGNVMAARDDLLHRHFLLHQAFENVVERTEEHTSELQSLMRISYAVFCLKQKTIQNTHIKTIGQHQTLIRQLDLTPIRNIPLTTNKHETK